MDYAEIVRLFSELHGEVKDALEAKEAALAMRLLERCQGAALELGNRVEAVRGKGCHMVAILEDYCELVYEVNEPIWHGEYIIPGKVYRYLNRSLELVKENLSLETAIPKET